MSGHQRDLTAAGKDSSSWGRLVGPLAQTRGAGRVMHNTYDGRERADALHGRMAVILDPADFERWVEG